MKTLSSQPFSYGLPVALMQSLTDSILGRAQRGANRGRVAEVIFGRDAVSASLNVCLGNLGRRNAVPPSFYFTAFWAGRCRCCDQKRWRGFLAWAGSSFTDSVGDAVSQQAGGKRRWRGPRRLVDAAPLHLVAGRADTGGVSPDFPWVSNLCLPGFRHFFLSHRVSFPRKLLAR